MTSLHLLDSKQVLVQAVLVGNYHGSGAAPGASVAGRGRTWPIKLTDGHAVV